MAAVNKKSKFVTVQQVNVIALLLLQILAAMENYHYSRMKILHRDDTHIDVHENIVYKNTWLGN